MPRNLASPRSTNGRGSAGGVPRTGTTAFVRPRPDSRKHPKGGGMKSTGDRWYLTSHRKNRHEISWPMRPWRPSAVRDDGFLRQTSSRRGICFLQRPELRNKSPQTPVSAPAKNATRQRRKGGDVPKGKGWSRPPTKKIATPALAPISDFPSKNSAARRGGSGAARDSRNGRRQGRSTCYHREIAVADGGNLQRAGTGNNPNVDDVAGGTVAVLTWAARTGAGG